MLPVCLHPSSHSPICSFSHTIITLVVRVSHSWSMLENIFVIYSSLPTTSLFYFPFLGFPPSFIFVLSVFVPQSTRCWFTVLLYASWPAVEQLTYPLHQWWWSHLTTKQWGPPHCCLILSLSNRSHSTKCMPNSHTRNSVKSSNTPSQTHILRSWQAELQAHKICTYKKTKYIEAAILCK